MKSHYLAKQLLALPDMEIFVEGEASLLTPEISTYTYTEVEETILIINCTEDGEVVIRDEER